MFSYILWALLAYFLYRFIVGFLIPVFRVTRQMKKQVRDFQQQANQQFTGQQEYHQQSTYNSNAATSTSSAQNKTAPKKDDYIDFEEIKE